MTLLTLPVQPGTIGARGRTVRVVDEPLSNGDVLMMHSYGIARRNRIPTYDNEVFREPERLADAIMDNHWRTHDDASVVIVRYSPDD